MKNILKQIIKNESIKNKKFSYIVIKKRDFINLINNEPESVITKKNNLLNKRVKNYLNLKKDTKLSYMLLSYILDIYKERFTEVIIGKHGKPEFNSGVCFNYSHSENYIALAISKFDIGVDIEEKGRKLSSKLINKYLKDNKNDEKKNKTGKNKTEKNKNDYPLKLWVKKEAYSKMDGRGFQIGFDSLDLNEIKEEGFFEETNEYYLSIFLKI